MECTDGAAHVKTSNAARVGDASVVPVADAPAGSAGCFQPGQGSVWARGFGQWNSLDGDSNAPGYDEDQFGFLFGADYAFHDHMFLGIAGGYFNSNGSFDSWAGRDGAAINYDGLQLAAYGGYDNSVYYLRGVASYGNYQGDANRTVDSPGGRRVSLSGDPSSDTWSFYGETGYRFGLGGAGSLTPFAGLSLATATLEGFTEDQSKGNAAALEIHDSDGSSVASVLGARFEADMSMGSGIFTPTVAVSWMHEFDNTAQEVDMSFAGAPSGADFTAKGSEVARDSMLVDAGAKFSFNDAVDLGLFYNGQFNADYTSNAVTARIGYKF
jgi:outer membrane autotransporter protein